MHSSISSRCASAPTGQQPNGALQRLVLSSPVHFSPTRLPATTHPTPHLIVVTYTLHTDHQLWRGSRTCDTSGVGTAVPTVISRTAGNSAANGWTSLLWNILGRQRQACPARQQQRYQQSADAAAQLHRIRHHSVTDFTRFSSLETCRQRKRSMGAFSGPTAL